MKSHRFASRPRSILLLVLVLLLSATSTVIPRPTRAAIHILEISATIDFVGCPSAISCPSFPLMWGVSGGEAVTARVAFDDTIPLAFIDDASPQYIFARHDHALPLSPPLGMNVQFGPYAAVVGSSGAVPDRYAISIFDDLGSGCCPGLPESMGIEVLVPDFSLTLTGPAGLHDLDLRAVRLEFLNYGGAGNLLSGAAIVPGFQDFGWEEIRLSVDVFDPIYGRDGTAFIDVQGIETVTLQGVTVLSPGGLVTLGALLVAAASGVAFRRSLVA
jgi:hypothetical protein